MKNSLKTITHHDLATMIQNGGCQAAAMDIVTDPKMRKTGNPFMGAMKHGTIGGMIGMSYGNGVNNQAGREDQEMNFTPHPRKWGQRVGNLVEHNGQWYVEMIVKSNSSTAYFFNGEEMTGIELDRLISFMPTRRFPTTQDHIEKKVILRDVKFESIKVIRIGGEEYEVVASHIDLADVAVEIDAPQKATKRTTANA